MSLSTSLFFSLSLDASWFYIVACGKGTATGVELGEYFASQAAHGHSRMKMFDSVCSPFVSLPFLSLSLSLSYLNPFGTHCCSAHTFLPKVSITAVQRRGIVRRWQSLAALAAPLGLLCLQDLFANAHLQAPPSVVVVLGQLAATTGCGMFMLQSSCRPPAVHANFLAPSLYFAHLRRLTRTSHNPHSQCPSHTLDILSVENFSRYRRILKGC